MVKFEFASLLFRKSLMMKKNIFIVKSFSPVTPLKRSTAKYVDLIRRGS
jgi:hypothetical protein